MLAFYMSLSVFTCPGVVSRLAAPPPSASHPPLPPRPPLMERMRKIKRQLSLTLGRGGAGGGDRTLNDAINQDVTSHSDSGNTRVRRCERRTSAAVRSVSVQRYLDFLLIFSAS